MRQYQSHKVVEAGRITNIIGGGMGLGAVLELEDDNVTVDSAYLAKHKPAVGGYYIKYPDGYESWSPADSFESGYLEYPGASVDPGNHGPILSMGEAQATVDLKENPRVSEGSILARIADVRYIYDGTGTFCIIKMNNSFEVNGFSKPAHPDNYDKGVGERYAYENAFRQLWQLEGYLLCEHLYQLESPEGL